jgi:hypothetical protein
MIRTAAAIAALTVLAACGSSSSDDADSADEPKLTRFEQIVDRCGSDAGELGDSGMTLVVKISQVNKAAGCALRGAGMPESITARMETTTALSGTQTGEWEDTKASWTYNPSNGLQIVLEDTTPEIFQDR